MNYEFCFKKIDFYNHEELSTIYVHFHSEFCKFSPFSTRPKQLTQPFVESNKKHVYKKALTTISNNQSTLDGVSSLRVCLIAPILIQSDASDPNYSRISTIFTMKNYAKKIRRVKFQFTSWNWSLKHGKNAKIPRKKCEKKTHKID